MRVETASIVVVTNGKGTYEITDRIAAAVCRSSVTRASWPYLADLAKRERI